MPLLDHFHPPLLGHRHWEGFHGRWAAAMADGLNDNLPAEYFAEFQVTLGTRVEVDVATFTEGADPQEPRPNGAATAVQTRVWAPPTPVAMLPALFPDDLEVQVFSSVAGPTLVAAIELVSPRNKDRDEARRAFAAAKLRLPSACVRRPCQISRPAPQSGAQEPRSERRRHGRAGCPGDA